MFKFFLSQYNLFLVLFLFAPNFHAEEKVEEKAEEKKSNVLPIIQRSTKPIKNPYHKFRIWRLWVDDVTPFEYTGFRAHDKKLTTQEIIITPESKRLYPDLTKVSELKKMFYLTSKPGKNTGAGIWDDGYTSLDRLHTQLRSDWKDLFGNRYPIKNQYIKLTLWRPKEKGDIGGGTGPYFQTRLALGINFTSRSESAVGHNHVDDQKNLVMGEKEFFFVNTVKGTPGYRSFGDILPDRVIDSYDGLYSHIFNSLGRSGSEIGALMKMLIAGGYLPRETKDLLKENGVYASALLTIFRQSLPYVSAEGKTLDFHNELFHRPVYLSYGASCTAEFASRNLYYHRYEGSRHLMNMINLAKTMTVAPPVTILHLKDFAVLNNGEKVEDENEIKTHVKSVVKTNIRIWGKPGETLEAEIDLNKSYDLQDLPLTFDCKAVYPGQKNIQISKTGKGIYKIIVKYDPKMPRTRFPVVLTAHNGKFYGNPVFVNFYWPQEGQKENPPYAWRGSKNYKSDAKLLTEVINNKRPIIKTGLPDNQIFCQPGEKISFNIETEDPEGFPTLLYRWKSDVGTLKNNVFSFTIPEDAENKIIPVHFICSDGTGAYGSIRVKMIVKKQNPLPDGWKSTVIGLPEAMGTAKIEGNTLSLTGTGAGFSGSGGGFAIYKEAEQHIDQTIDVSDFYNDTENNNNKALAIFGVVNNLEDRPQGFLIDSQKRGPKQPPMLRCYQEIPFRRGSFFVPEKDQKKHFLRIIRNSNQFAGYYSQDNKNWQMLWQSSTYLDEKPVLMLGVSSNDRVRDNTPHFSLFKLQFPEQHQISLPMIKISTLSGKRDCTISCKNNAKITLLSLGKEDIYYTLDGSEPTKDSLKYSKPFPVDKEGENILKVKMFSANLASDTVTFKFVRKK
jgi:Fn3 domain-containing protein